MSLTRHKIVLHIVAYLLVATAVALLNRLAHGLCDLASVHYHKSILMTRCTTRYLCYGADITEHALHICVNNRDERHLWQVQTLT